MARLMLGLGLFAWLLVATAAELSQQRRDELHNLLLHDCGSCHGMTMKGGLGPALTPEVLQNKDREMLIVTVLEGRHGTPMPPWSTMLNRDEVEWLVDQLYEGVTP
jgi:cytochrome c55X